MSIRVPLDEVAATVDVYGSKPFLLTTGDDGRPHATHVTVSVDGAILQCGLGRRTAQNAAARPKVSLLWSAIEQGGDSLIVDGDIVVSGDTDTDPAGTITPTSAILHRPR